MGIAALSGLLGDDLRAAGNRGVCRDCLTFAPTAKRVIYLFQSGAPSQMDLFDYKPRLQEFARQELPESVRMGQRLTGMTSGQTSFPVAPSVFQFRQHGASGAWVSELMPHLTKVVDDRLLHQVDVHRGDQSRSRGDFLPDGISDRGTAVDRGLAVLWTWEARTRIFRHLS